MTSDYGELCHEMRERGKVVRASKSEQLTPIIEQLGGKLIAAETYRLGDYNCYVSKGFAMHKSNRGDKINLVKLLNKEFNAGIDREAVYQNVNAAVKKAGF